jgi:hypothetical protein
MAQTPVPESSASFDAIQADLVDMQAQIDDLAAKLAEAAEMAELQDIVRTPTLVADLPNATLTVNIGLRAFVTDATVGLTAGIGATVAGGGAISVPVVCDGTNWLIG